MFVWKHEIVTDLIMHVSKREKNYLHPVKVYYNISVVYFVYRCLIDIYFRFKISNMMAFPFSWNELYTQSNFASTDVEYELASVLYNIGTDFIVLILLRIYNIHT